MVIRFGFPFGNNWRILYSSDSIFQFAIWLLNSQNICYIWWMMFNYLTFSLHSKKERGQKNRHFNKIMKNRKVNIEEIWPQVCICSHFLSFKVWVIILYMEVMSALPKRVCIKLRHENIFKWALLRHCWFKQNKHKIV